MLLRGIGVYVEDVISTSDQLKPNLRRIKVEDEKSHVLSTSGQLRPNLRRIKHVQQDKGQAIPGIFAIKPINQLENVDQLLLHSDFYQKMDPDSYRKFQVENEFNYIFNSSNPKCVIAISSYRKLILMEKTYLFKNISHVLLRPKSVNTTLDDIIKIPLNYIGRDIKESKYVSKDLLIDRIDQEVEEIMKKMHENIEKAILRGESLEQLQSKALTLDDHAIEFKTKTHNVNRCCRT